jgi:periplasmic divalent cation tolerance protein
MTDMILVYIPCKNIPQATTIGKLLLHKKLCACINIIPSMHSIYLWPPGSDTLEKSNEAVLLVKTMQSKYQLLEDEVNKIHSYQTPCVLALPVYQVNQKYYEWIQGEVEGNK